MTDKSYQVRPYQPGDEEGILELFHLVFQADTPVHQRRTLDQWRWEFADNPAGQQIIVAVTPGGQVVAQYACLPARAQMDGQVGLAVQGVDSMVHPDWRRGLQKQGPFLAVGRRYMETWGNAREALFGFGYPNRKAFRVGVRLLGYQPVIENLPTLYRNFFEAPDDDAVGRAHQDAAQVVPVERFGEEVTALWNELRKDFPFALVRDQAYLNWRYADCTRAGYRLFEVRDGDRLRAWFVTRAGWQDLPILALADFFAAPGDHAALALALRQAVREARTAGMGRVELWLPPASEWFGAALDQGFQTEPCQYNLCVMLYQGTPSLDQAREQWYFTIGDSDVF